MLWALVIAAKVLMSRTAIIKKAPNWREIELSRCRQWFFMALFLKIDCPKSWFVASLDASNPGMVEQIATAERWPRQTLPDRFAERAAPAADRSPGCDYLPYQLP